MFCHLVNTADMSERREAILSKAYEMMGDTGLESVHARTVAAALKINHATVHYYFPTRADLLTGVAEMALTRLEKDRLTFTEDGATANERIAGMVELAAAYSKKGSRWVKVMAGLMVAALTEPKLVEPSRALWTSWRRALAAELEGARIHKRSPYANADLLASQLVGAALVAQVTGGGAAMEGALSGVTASIDG